MIEVKPEAITALVIHPLIGRQTKKFAKHKLDEVNGLTIALGAEVAVSLDVPVRDIKAGKFFGGGKVDEIGELIKTKKINLVIINSALAPIQQRNLEKAWNVKVVDRTGLILEIFALRAATKEGRLQVELARLAYERSRLVRTWTHLERQRGGQGFLAGPGETQIESDRRMLADKIRRLEKDLKQVRRTRALQRTKRKRAPERVVALVGYTNAGKSSLFNRLTRGGVLEKDMLFATLDTTHRVLPLPNGGNAVLSDTVGFISDLPTDLIDAFRATLEEVKEADLLVHVRDISDPLSELHKQDVLEILSSLQAGPEHNQDIIEVWNKIDLLDEDIRTDLLASIKNRDDVVATICVKEFGLDRALELIEAKLSARDEIINVVIGPKDMKMRAWLHKNAQVLSEHIKNANVHMQVRLSSADMGKFTARAKHLIQ